MSVESKYKPVSYTGTGGTSVFPFGWVCYEKTWIHVSADGLELTQGTDYTVALESTSGGSVTLSAPLAAGKVLIIWMDVPITQENRYPNTGQLNTVTIERALDKQTLIAQQQQDAIERSVKVPVGSQEKPEDVVQNIYGARDAAAASATAASAQATAAQTSAQDAASSADAAAQTVQNAAADAVNAATVQASAAAASATDAAQYAAQAEAASSGLAPRVDAVEAKDSQQDTRLSGVESNVATLTATLNSAATELAAKADKTLGNVDPSKAKVLLQVLFSKFNTFTSISSPIPMDDTIPQNNEGVQIFSTTITAKKANSTVEFTLTLPVSCSGSSSLVAAAIFIDSAANAYKSGIATVPFSGGVVPLVISDTIQFGDTQPHTIAVRAGGNFSNYPMTINGGSSRIHGGALEATFMVKESV